MKLHLNKKEVLEKLFAFSYRLYCTYINIIETHTIVNQKFINQNKFEVWHDRLGHPKTLMMRKIIENSCRHLLKNQKILQLNFFMYCLFPKEVNNQFITSKNWG
uniref:GAG-pre-integrase domain-containing protein n=1 Tax=Cajanus cajan TaxID=3821 RepID=A0A151SMV7_CAJCA|nr:hypothetical protein KK1_002309 [Cajanus cajan]